MKTAIELITEERQRQIVEKGWTCEHDDTHVNCELADAAACYAAGYPLYVETHDGENTSMGFDIIWPWDINYWKPNPENRIEDLTKAGALIVAEIERLQRLSQNEKVKCPNCTCEN